MTLSKEKNIQQNKMHTQLQNKKLRICLEYSKDAFDIFWGVGVNGLQDIEINYKNVI